jgi:outer membrane protein assembly factor BamA
MAGSRAAFLLLVILGAFSVAACREEGDIQISSLKFTGVEQVDADALASALQTKKGSRLPWGRKRFFDRRAFEADLKRIEAFYRDRECAQDHQ